ncbi:putative iron/ascorbate oxidoreductase, partial [Trifolium medium]|nr:putative iron/ascorbate oxidoreductase [Trifolium medium]
GLYAAGAHTDYGLITLLATDDVQGLQICKNKDAEPQIWEDVTPLKGLVLMVLWLSNAELVRENQGSIPVEHILEEGPRALSCNLNAQAQINPIAGPKD